MHDPSPPKQSPLSIGVAWASRVTTLALEFALPALVGSWIDGRLSSRPWGMLVGAVLGFAVGMVHLLQIARQGQGPGTPGRDGDGPRA